MALADIPGGGGGFFQYTENTSCLLRSVGIRMYIYVLSSFTLVSVSSESVIIFHTLSKQNCPQWQMCICRGYIYVHIITTFLDTVMFSSEVFSLDIWYCCMYCTLLNFSLDISTLSRNLPWDYRSNTKLGSTVDTAQFNWYLGWVCCIQLVSALDMAIPVHIHS
jgi:hypothetical protein